MTGRLLFAWSTPLISILLLSVALELFLTRPAAAAMTVFSDPALTAPRTLAAAVVAALIVWRRPGNAVGWVVAAVAITGAITTFAAQYAIRWRAVPVDFPAGIWLAWLNQWLFFAEFLLLAGFVPLIFPTGRPLTPRWRPALVLMALATLAMSANGALTAGPMDGLAGRDNPAGLIPAHLAGLLVGPVVGLFFGVVLLAVASLIVRFRRATGVERQQLKWLVYAVALVVLFSFTNSLAFLTGRASDVAAAATILSLALIPLAIGVALLRYRLYEIDVLINRTIVYAALSAVLVAAYVASVAAFQFLLSPFTSGSPIAVAVSTLAVVALFQPVRTRIQNAVDRRFYRAKYDAARTLDAFAVRLRDEIDLEALRAELLDVVGQTIQPAHASLWLR
ncbi:MAG: hypothetical protein M3P16_00575 [Chloroflexota bacterium]|nr:hypothetical protein [Chloroflexota bacterium]